MLTTAKLQILVYNEYMKCFYCIVGATFKINSRKKIASLGFSLSHVYFNPNNKILQY